MADAALGRLRLVAQGLVTRPYARPADAVEAFGAMQGQDLPGVLASATLRTPSDDIAGVLEDLDAGRLVRAYPMRGTVFLMSAADARWVSELCNAAMLRAQERRRSHHDLDDAQVERARTTLREALAFEPRGLPREAVMARWNEVGIATEKGRGYHVLSYLIGRGEVVFGPWNGSDQNVVLADAWLPPGSSLQERFGGERVPAVAELLRRYLTSHGPATLADFAWWTKLTKREITAALPLVAADLETDGERYWRPGLLDEAAGVDKDARRAFLLPGFDEFVLGYQDRLFAMTPEQHTLLVPGNNGVFGKSVVLGGQVVGIWRRGGRPGRRALDVTAFGELSAARTRALQQLFADHPFPTP